MKFILLVTFLLGFYVNATIILPDVLSDNMVLQQNSSIKLWGSSKVNTLVKVNVSWSTIDYQCLADKNGKWKVFIPTNAASFQKHSIDISDGKSITIKNVLVGEVWLCSGQSNMEMPFRGFNDQLIKDADFYVSTAKVEVGIRMFTVVKNAEIKSSKIGKGNWTECSSKDLPNCSATAYFFALRLQTLLNVPIGIINSSYGGSSIEGWLNPIAVQKYTDLDLNKTYNDENAWQRPYVMYQNMLKPYRGYVINGFLWYQGESNVLRYGTYAQKLHDLVSLWRTTFNNPELPFYAVEIAPFQYGNGVQAAKLREAQFKGINAIKNTGFVCTNDLVDESEATNIHPSQKKPIGDRLANLVLHDTYHVDTIKANSPSLERVTITSDSIVMQFENSYEGLQNQLEFIGFEVADSTTFFRTAQPFLGADKSSLIIKIDKGFAPIAVRYCFKNFQVGNVKNSVGLPLVPFRTDEWDN